MFLVVEVVCGGEKVVVLDKENTWFCSGFKYCTLLVFPTRAWYLSILGRRDDRMISFIKSITSDVLYHSAN